MSSTTLSSISSQAGALSKTRHVTAQNVLMAQRSERYSSSGIWVGVFAITMSFAAFTSALFVREGTTDWGHLALPSILYFNTFLLLLGSVTLEISRRSLPAGARFESAETRKAIGWLALTLFLG